MLYRKNSTMELLGKQVAGVIIGVGTIGRDDFKNLLEAYNSEEVYYSSDLAMDAFMLGYIYGKRAERARRRKGV